MSFFEFLQSALDHSRGRPKTALPTRFHYLEIVEDALALHGIHIERFGQHSVLLKDRELGAELIVAIRYATARDLQRILDRKKRNGSRVAFLLDDDYWAMLEDKSLRSDYRDRIGFFLSNHFPSLSTLLDAVVAPSWNILERFSDTRGIRMQPAHLNPSGDLDHFDNCEQVRMVFLGTSTHGADFERVASGIGGALKANPQLHLTTLLGERGESVLPAGRQVRHIGDMYFPRFQSWLVQQRFHLGLAPYEPNSVNDGRSNLKLHQHALVGAAGFYSTSKPFVEAFEPEMTSCLLDYTPEAWATGIDQAVSNLSVIKAMARKQIALSHQAGSHSGLVQLWKDLLSAPLE